MGNAFTEVCDYPAACHAYQEALRIAHALGDDRTEAKWCGNLGLVYTAQEKHEEAIEAYNAARKTHELLVDKPALIRDLIHLATYLRFTGQYDASFRTFVGAYELSQELAENLPKIQSLAGLGSIARILGDYAEA